MSTVYVLNKDGKPLMPTTRCGHVRYLLKEKKARVVKTKPFTIQLLYETNDVVQPLYLGIDPGRTNIGVAVVKADGTAVFTAHLETRNKEIPKLMKKRKDSRCARRTNGRRCRRQRRAKAKVSEDTTVKVAIKERGKATGEWEKAKEALHKAEAELEKQEMQKALYESNLRTREKRVTSYDAILTNIRKAQQEKQMQSIEKEQSLRHREVFSGGHNAVRSKKQTDALLNEDVSKLSNADIEKVLTFIRTNAKTFRQKLRKLYMTQQKKQIDVKKTIEKSVQCDGEIARLYYKKPIKSKANVVMLADISGSCRAMTSLALTYMGLMREVFPGGCHLFVFVNHLVPVDRYFSNENVTSAVESINKSVPSRGIYSNYGVPLKELRYDNTGIINKDTTIVMLGDCRNNKNYSGVEEVEWLSKRASNFFVLNPDPLNKWGQGDSIADLYAKSGATVCRVSSTQDLLTFLESASLRKQA